MSGTVRAPEPARARRTVGAGRVGVPHRATGRRRDRACWGSAGRSRPWCGCGPGRLPCAQRVGRAAARARPRRARSRRPATTGCASLVPGDAEWPARSRPAGTSRRTACSCAATPTWRPWSSAASRSSGRARRPSTACASRPTWPTGWPRAGSPSSAALPTGSTPPRTAAALAADGPTVAVLACGADRAYPTAAPCDARPDRPGRGGGQRGAGRVRAVPVAVPRPQPDHRHPGAGHRRRRGQPALGLAHHGQGGARPPPAGRRGAGAGHEHDLGRLPRAAARDRCRARHRRRGGRRARRADRRGPACPTPGSGRSRPRPGTTSTPSPTGCGRRYRCAAARPTDRLASASGVEVRRLIGILAALEADGLVSREAGRLAQDQPVRPANSPVMTARCVVALGARGVTRCAGERRPF